MNLQTLAEAGYASTEYIRKYGLTTFVETGSYLGDSIAYAIASGFKNIHSCDIGPMYHKICTDRFPDKNIVLADSITFLSGLLINMEEPSLFWLDAHYPAWFHLMTLEQETPLTRFPLFKEMELVKTLKKGYEKDVIICDDIRVLRSPDNPMYNTADNINTNTAAGDLYVDTDYKAFMNFFADTHDTTLVMQREGSMIFTPKV